MTTETNNKTININNIITEKIQKIIDDANKPRSIKELQEHFQLEFPFYVKRVINSNPPAFEGVSEITEISQVELNLQPSNKLVYCSQNYIQFENPKKQIFQSAETPDYILVITNH